MDNYKNIIQTSMDGFWLVDSQGKILDVNDAACKMSGYSREEMLKMSVTDLESKETAADTSAHIEKVIREGGDRFETRHKTKDGRVIEVEISVVFNPDTQQFFSFLRNISNRKQVEALEEFKKITEGREMKMIELKARIKELEDQLAAKNM